MVRFSCFPNPIHNKSKKSHQRPTESLQKNLGHSPKDLMAKATGSSPCSSPLQLKAHDNRTSIMSGEQMISSSSSECCLKSEEMASSFSPEDNREVLQKVRLMKSQSLGSGLYKEGRVSCVVDTEDEMDQGFSGDDSHEKSFNRMLDDFNHNGLTESFDSKEPGTFMLNQLQETTIVESFHSNGDVVLNESIFSIGETQQLERELQEDTSTNLSVEHVGDSGRRTLNTTDRTARILKSCSLPNIRVCSSTLQEGLPAVRFLGPRSRSLENLHAFDFRREVLNYKSRCPPSCYNISQASPSPGKRSPCREVLGEDCVLSNPSGGSFEVADHERHHVSENGKQTSENVFGDGYDSFNFTDLSKEWKVSEIEEVGEGNSNIPRKTPVHRWDELSCKEFHSRRIEEWISSIDLQEKCSLPEIGECSDPAPEMKKDTLLISGLTTAKRDHKVTPGMELGNHYVSSLTAGSTSAQMANLGLVAIPFLSAFSSLRVLNLAGNGIVKITAGALPRGLHVLNLSKNNISTIEGLRELTRLRALDLSYNRIFRIGHGLASCSSLKELYLAGNKISEVEGLHRLLKLNILDLRFNKISTAKSLGQLAANYSSLQAINLEGNPAQRNVGDDHLKKYLLSLLPHLVYFNRQMVSRNSSSKEIGDRPARSITSYQFDRSLRSEHKLSRRGSHGTATHKPASSSHGRSSQALGSPKRSRGRHGRHPPTGSKGFHQLNIDSRLLNFAPGLAMRRSRSEGNL